MTNANARQNAWGITFRAPMNLSVLWATKRRDAGEVQPMRHMMLSEPVRTFRPAHGLVWVFGRNSSAWKLLRYKPN